MKTLHSLTQPLTQLRQKSERLRALLSFRVSDTSATANPSECETKQGDWPTRQFQRRFPFQRSKGTPPRNRKPQGRSPVMWVVAVISLTSVMGDRFYNQPKLDVGKAAPQTIRAPFDASIEDSKTTEEKRKEARTGSFPVLMIDRTLTEEIEGELQQSLDKMEQLRQVAGAFPFVQTAILSDSTQQYLRQSKKWEWDSILAFAKRDPNVNPFSRRVPSPKESEELANLAFVQAVNELQSYRKLSSPQAFAHLIDAIKQAREGYDQALRQLSELNTSESNPRYNPALLALSDSLWQETKHGIVEVSKRILTQGIPPGLPPEILQDAVKMQVSTLVPAEGEPVALQLLSPILQPNLTEDKEQTKRRAEQAAQAVEPVMVSVERGEVIIQGGEEITQPDFVLLDYFGLSHREINWLGLIGFGSLVSGAVVIFWLVEQGVHPRLRRRDHILLLLLSVSMPLLVRFNVPYTDLPAIGLLVGSFYGSSLGVTVVSLLTGLVTFSMEVSWEYLLAGAAGGLIGALMAGRMRSREELAVLGSTVGLTQGAVYLILNLVPSAAVGAVWYTVLQEAALYGLAGLVWSVVALGISSYLEPLFDLVTPIRLAELSNPNRPLLKRLATEAPGTFQHTLFVASLAEAAARELHCNVELVRAGTLYHDIGKMHDPLGFIENQMGNPNKHDEINNPWKSAEIIKKHVSEGLVMARKHQLPKAIRDFIPEHQGTLLISYFYFQAQQKAQQEGSSPVEESDFRYDGPIPQSRETGIVMLADACEAALRSLKDVSLETALGTVNKIFKARWQDNQLVDSGLTREELSIIAEVFVTVWQQYNHQRIAYPKGALK
ncbi:MAG TPA: hypothetical protein DD379_05295 [Cyanobacteria bacterium UBA11162]|nr:hypothetical protein [Cyanobacteria bacterium UBA11162]